MAYAIGYIVFGIDLQGPGWQETTDEWEDFRDIINELAEMEIDEPIVTRAYSGGGEEPLYIGTDLGQIDECDNIDGEALMAMLVPTDEQKLAFDQKLKTMYGEAVFFDFYAKLINTPPKVFITWGTS